MTPFLSALTGFHLYNDGKPHPAEGIAMFVMLILGIFCFDRFVIQRERHRRHWEKHKTFGQRVKFSFLQLIDFLVGLYFWRVRVRDEPFRKATEGEKRAGTYFMILWPAVLAFVTAEHQWLDSVLNFMTSPRHWIGWFYISCMALVGGAGAFGIVVAPKIPLKITVPLAITAWLVLGYEIWTHHLI